MIVTYNVARGSGKTTEVIKMLKADDSLYCLVPANSFLSLFPMELCNRIIVLDTVSSIKGRNIKRVVLDEGFAYKKDILAKLFYYLGVKGIDTVVYGTIE